MKKSARNNRIKTNTNSNPRENQRWIVRFDDLERLVIAHLKFGSITVFETELNAHHSTWKKIVGGAGLAWSTVTAISKLLDHPGITSFAHLEGTQPSPGNVVTASPLNPAPLAENAALRTISRRESHELIHQTLIEERPTELWASIDRGEGVNELFNSMPSSIRLSLKRIVLKVIRVSTVEQLLKLNAIGENHIAEREAVERSLRRKLPRVSIERDEWDALPPFHGILTGDCFVFGYWRVGVANPGQLTVDGSEMFAARVSQADELTRSYIEWLKTPSQLQPEPRKSPS